MLEWIKKRDGKISFYNISDGYVIMYTKKKGFCWNGLTNLSPRVILKLEKLL